MSLTVQARRALRIAAFVVLAADVAGCAAISASANLVAADKALGRAEAKNAPELAVYEYTMAVRHYEKAREEVGYNKYKDATLLAKSSADWADKSIIAIETEGRDVSLDTLGPAAPVAAPDVPPPPALAPPPVAPTAPPPAAPTTPPAAPLPTPPSEPPKKIIVVPVTPPPEPAPAPWGQAP